MENYLKLNKITLTKIIFSLRDLSASNFYELREKKKKKVIFKRTEPELLKIEASDNAAAADAIAFSSLSRSCCSHCIHELVSITSGSLAQQHCWKQGDQPQGCCAWGCVIPCSPDGNLSWQDSRQMEKITSTSHC